MKTKLSKVLYFRNTSEGSKQEPVDDESAIEEMPQLSPMGRPFKGASRRRENDDSPSTSQPQKKARVPAEEDPNQHVVATYSSKKAQSSKKISDFESELLVMAREKHRLEVELLKAKLETEKLRQFYMKLSE